MRIAIPASLIQEPERVARCRTILWTSSRDPGGDVGGVRQCGAPMEEPSSRLGRHPRGRDGIPGTEAPPMRLFKNVFARFLSTAGTRLIAGRDYTWPDLQDLRPVVMISENLARELWGNLRRARQTATDQRPASWHEIIGVVRTFVTRRVNPPPATVYWPSPAHSERTAEPNAIRAGDLRRPQRANRHGGISEPGPAGRVVGELQPARVADGPCRTSTTSLSHGLPSRW